MIKADKSLLVSLHNSDILLVCKSMQRFDKPTVYKKAFKCLGNNSWMSSPRVTFKLKCGNGVTELQNLTNLRLSSFAESHQMQQKNLTSPLICRLPIAIICCCDQNSSLLRGGQRPKDVCRCAPSLNYGGVGGGVYKGEGEGVLWVRNLPPSLLLRDSQTS